MQGKENLSIDILLPPICKLALSKKDHSLYHHIKKGHDVLSQIVSRFLFMNCWQRCKYHEVGQTFFSIKITF